MIADEDKGETLQQHASEVHIDLNPGGKMRKGARHHAGSFNEEEESSSLQTPLIEGNSNKNANGN